VCGRVIKHLIIVTYLSFSERDSRLFMISIFSCVIEFILLMTLEGSHNILVYIFNMFWLIFFMEQSL